MQQTEYLTTILVISMVSSFILSFPIIHLLYKFNLTRRGEVDFSNLIDDRKKKVGTPIMGGLIIVITVLLINMVFNKDPNGAISGSIKIPLFIFGLSALLGGVDDVLNIYGRPRKVQRIRRILKLINVHRSVLKRIFYVLILPWLVYKRIFFILGSNPGKGIQAHEKVLVQAVVGLILAYWIMWGTHWTNPSMLWIPLIGNINIGLFMVPFIVFSVISMSNAVNLSDGMDGLAAGLLLSSLSGFLLISITQNDTHIAFLIVSIIGSLVSYLYFNIPPARFQMGDVGSLALGTMLAAIAFALKVPILLPIIGFPFVAEVGTSLLQGVARRILGRRLFAMAPLHHHFEVLGWKEEKVVMRFWLFGIFASIFGVWIYILLV